MDVTRVARGWKDRNGGLRGYAGWGKGKYCARAADRGLGAETVGRAECGTANVLGNYYVCNDRLSARRLLNYFLLSTFLPTEEKVEQELTEKTYIHCAYSLNMPQKLRTYCQDSVSSPAHFFRSCCVALTVDLKR